MFAKGQVVKIPGLRPVFIEVQEGPFKIGQQDVRTYYKGWRLVDKDDPFSEPTEITVMSAQLVAADDINDILAHVQLPKTRVAIACS